MLFYNKVFIRVELLIRLSSTARIHRCHRSTAARNQLMGLKQQNDIKNIQLSHWTSDFKNWCSIAQCMTSLTLLWQLATQPEQRDLTIRWLQVLSTLLITLLRKVQDSLRWTKDSQTRFSRNDRFINIITSSPAWFLSPMPRSSLLFRSAFPSSISSARRASYPSLVGKFGYLLKLKAQA